MTRWERLLLILGVTDDEFELEHKTKFDLSPESWLKDRIAYLDSQGDEDDVLSEVTCSKPCCLDTGD